MGTLSPSESQQPALCYKQTRLPSQGALPCPPLLDLHLCPLVPQGLFRLAAGASVLKRLKQTMASDPSSLEEFCSDPHAVAGT